MNKVNHLQKLREAEAIIDLLLRNAKDRLYLATLEQIKKLINEAICCVVA